MKGIAEAAGTPSSGKFNDSQSVCVRPALWIDLWKM
jgi:hypothetical protein